jgi:hypothetical protein
LALRDWVDLEFRLGDHAPSVAVVFVSGDGKYAAAARDNHRVHHPHLVAAAAALDSVQAPRLKPLLVQAGRVVLVVAVVVVVVVVAA